MKVILLLLLLQRLSQTSTARDHAFVKTSSGMTQFFEYENISVSCEHFGPDWTVWRENNDRVFSQCGSGWGTKAPFTCKINTIKVADGGAYWCQSKYGDSSNTVNLTVNGGAVILQSPVLPVMEGDDVTLRCKTKSASSNLPADFYKDGSFIRTESTGHMTIHKFSKSNEGVYKCKINDNRSPESWLLIKESYVASITATPEWSQIYEYGEVSLSCGPDSSSHGWKVFKTTKDPSNRDVVKPCPVKNMHQSLSGCSVQTAKRTDGGVYWCQSPQKQRSNSVKIHVHSGAVILQSPVLPVIEGDDVTLHCKTKSASSNLPADFYKDGSFIRTESTGHLTIHNVSMAHEGLYKCKINGDTSPESWLLIKAPSNLPTAERSVSTMVLEVLRYLVVSSPYVIATLVAVCKKYCFKKPTEKNTPVSMTMSQLVEDDESNNDDVTTQHNF